MEAHDTPSWVLIAYLIAGVCFIMALRGLSSPESSRRGNWFGIVGMTIAVVTTASSMPAIPKRFPRLELSGLESPRSARMKHAPEMR